MNEFSYSGYSISKSFDQYSKVFSGIDFHLTNSSFFGITGKNGSGKSTLLKIIAGLLSCSEGKLDFKLNEKSLSRKEYPDHYSFVAPYLQIYEEFTPKELIEIYCRFKKIKVDQERYRYLINIFQLDKRHNDQIRSFSSGMKQRMKYILAFHSFNEILLLDEPFTNLDTDGIEAVISLIEDHHRKGAAIVIAGNDKKEIDLCNEILEL
jgi:heme exporter protein A